MEFNKKNINTIEDYKMPENMTENDIHPKLQMDAKYLDSTSYKQYLETHVKDVEDRKKIRSLLESESAITEFKKLADKNRVVCSLEDGTREIIPVNETLELFFDKMEKHPEVDVDFGKEQKNRVEILPFQNRIAYIDGTTNRVIKSLPLDCNLIYSATDSITGNNVNVDSRLNPAVLSLLDSDLAAQKDYINGDGNLINIIYNFEIKSDNMRENIANKNLAKTMNKYYKSEKQYYEKYHSNSSISQKVGYVNMLDKIQSSFNKEERQTSQQNKLPESKIISFQQRREAFLKSIPEAKTSSTITHDSQNPVIRPRAVGDLDK